MLETLDQVGWPVPNLAQWIRQLASDDSDERRAAFRHFWLTVLHQGSVGQSTALVVPFWIELLGAPGYPERFELLVMLSTADAAYSAVPALRDWRSRRGMGEEDQHLIFANEADAHRAVVAGVGLYASLLGDPDPLLRIGSAQLLAVCVGAFASAHQALAGALVAERDPEVKAILIEEWARLWRQSGAHPDVTLPAQEVAARDDLLTTILRDSAEAPVVRAHAALALLRLARAARGEEALAVFRGVLPEAHGPHRLLRREHGHPLERTLLEDLAESLGGEQAVLLPLLAEVSEYPDDALRADAILRLVELARAHPDWLAAVAPLLARRLFDRARGVRQAAECLAEIEGVLSLLSDQPPAMLRRVEALVWHRRGLRDHYQKRHAEALAALAEAVRLEPERVDFYEARLQVYEALKDGLGLRADLETILRLDPANTTGLDRRAELRAVEGDYAGALDDLTRALAQESSPWSLDRQSRRYILRGRAHRALGEEHRAEEDFSHAIKILEEVPRRPQGVCAPLSLAYSLRGQVRNARGEHDTALADFAAARQFSWGHAGLAQRALQWLGAAAAEEVITRHLRDFPCEPHLYLERAQLEAQRKDYAAAFADIETALILDPRCQRAYSERAQLHERLRDWESALADHDRVAALSAAPHAQRQRRRCLEQIGGHARVVADCQARLERDPDDGDALCALAWLRATSADDTLRDGPQALALARRTLALRERFLASGGWLPSLLATLAAAHAEGGQPEEAAHWQAEAERHEPPVYVPSWVERYRAGGVRRTRALPA